MSDFYHPSVFQTPALDAKFNKDPSLVAETDPTTIWKHETSGLVKERPFSRQEKLAILSRVELCTNLNINKDILPLLLPLFMSRKNLEVLQSKIVAAVRDYSGHTIVRQSATELSLAMLATYESHARNVNEELLSKSDLILYVRQELTRLNNLVLTDLVPGIVNAVEQHLKFLATKENPYSGQSLRRPMNANDKGLIQYRSPMEIVSGSR